MNDWAYAFLEEEGRKHAALTANPRIDNGKLEFWGCIERIETDDERYALIVRDEILDDCILIKTNEEYTRIARSIGTDRRIRLSATITDEGFRLTQLRREPPNTNREP